MAADTAVTPVGPPPDRVELSVPADPAYLAVLRTACAGLAARLDLTLDEIEDLRIAVDEAGTLLLRGAGTGDRLRVLFWLDADVLDVEVHGPAESLPPRDSVAWAVLEALVGEVESAPSVQSGGAATGSLIRLRHARVVRT